MYRPGDLFAFNQRVHHIIKEASDVEQRQGCLVVRREPARPLWDLLPLLPSSPPLCKHCERAQKRKESATLTDSKKNVTFFD